MRFLIAISLIAVSIHLGATLTAEEEAQLNNVRVLMNKLHHTLATPSPISPTSNTVWTFHKDIGVYVGQYLGGGDQSRPLVAGFDFDGTLSNPKSGKTFAIDGQDFSIFDEALPGLINEIAGPSGNYRFVMFSNQLGIYWRKVKLEDVLERVTGILEIIKVPCTVFLSAARNSYRKPFPGMMQLLNDKLSHVQINVGESIYVGDAAGRNSSTHKDHSSDDLNFAGKLGMKFYTPEQFVNKEHL